MPPRTTCRPTSARCAASSTCVSEPVSAGDFETAARREHGRASAGARHARGPQIDYDDVLGTLEVPLLVTQGRADSVVLPAMAEHVLATCPTAEASWYDDVGHVPHLEEPDRFNRELATLARRIYAA